MTIHKIPVKTKNPTLNDIKLDTFILSHALLVLVGVVLGDGALVNKDVLVGIVPLKFERTYFSHQKAPTTIIITSSLPGYEAVAILHVEPFDGASHFGGLTNK